MAGRVMERARGSIPFLKEGVTMLNLRLSGFCLLMCAGLLTAQTSDKVDFAKDVQPILRQNCVGCHGGTQPASGLRLDRRSAVINRRGVVPGSAENSFLFHRISGTDYGMQMPPTGA